MVWSCNPRRQPSTNRAPPHLSKEKLFAKVTDFLNPKCIHMHTCDVPLCVNPKHIVLGTTYDNLWDALLKGRKHKLNPEAVKEIRAQHAAGKTCKEIAPHFNVSKTCIQEVVRMRSWRRV